MPRVSDRELFEDDDYLLDRDSNTSPLFRRKRRFSKRYSDTPCSNKSLKKPHKFKSRKEYYDDL